MAMGAIDHSARTRSQFRPRRRCPRATFTNLERPSPLPHYRQQSRRGNKALKRKIGWRREFRISQRIVVIDSAVSRPVRSRLPRRDSRLGRARPGRRDAPSTLSLGDRAIGARRIGTQIISLEKRRSAHLHAATSSRRGARMALRRNRGGTLGVRISYRAMGIADATASLECAYTIGSRANWARE